MAESRNQQPRNQQQSPPRQPRTMHGMITAVLVLVLLVGGMTGLIGRCSFNPGGPEVDQSAVPDVNVAQELDGVQQRVDFPLTRPQLPDAWRANSTNVTTLDSGAEVVRVGWLTGARHYLRLAQSQAPQEEFVGAETRQQPHARGTVDAAGHQWTVYDSVRGEHAWSTEVNGVRLLITGDGDRAEFRELAGAAIESMGR